MEGYETIVDKSGNFGDGFAGAARTVAGEGFEESKVFDDVKDLDTLIKNYANTKQQVGQKMEGVIQKPGENATDEERTEYQKALLSELGPAENPDEYDFGSTEDLGEGIEYDKDADTAWRGFFHEKGWPKQMVSEAAQFMREMTMKSIETAQAERKAEFDAAVTSFDKDFTGNAAIENNRLAYQAIINFGTDELKQAMKESGLYDDPGNHQKWLNTGFSPEQRRVWINIAKATKVKVNVPNEGGHKDGGGDTDASDIYVNSPELFKK